MSEARTADMVAPAPLNPVLQDIRALEPHKDHLNPVIKVQHRDIPTITNLGPRVSLCLNVTSIGSILLNISMFPNSSISMFLNISQRLTVP